MPYLQRESRYRSTVPLVGQATRHWIERVHAVDIERIPLTDHRRMTLARRPYTLQTVRSAPPLDRCVHGELAGGAVVVRGLRRLSIGPALGLYPLHWPESGGGVGDHHLRTVWGVRKEAGGFGRLLN